MTEEEDPEEAPAHAAESATAQWLGALAEGRECLLS